jgi:hypothetical protein
VAMLQLFIAYQWVRGTAKQLQKITGNAQACL